MKKFEGVTPDGEPQSVQMPEGDYQTFAYQRYNCIDEKSGAVDYLTMHTLSMDELLATVPEGGKTTKANYYAFVQDTFDSLLALIKRKNADYTAGADDAFANFRRAEPVVPMLEATWVRWGDKIQRVDAYFRNGKLEVANEGLEDALLDVIGYSMIMLGELKEGGNAK